MIESMFDGSLPEIGDLAALSDAELVASSAGWGRVESAAAARKLATMAEVFRRRTGLEHADDREAWFADPEASAVSELAAAQNITEKLAMFQTHRAVMLRDRLPDVAALFEAGLVSDSLVRAIVARTLLITDCELMAAVDAALADQITTWGPKSEKKTTTDIDAIVERHDPGALRHSKDALQERGTEFGFLGDAAGYMTVWARMYAPDGAALEQRVNDMAHSVCADDPRTMDDRRNDALAAIATGTTLRCECDNPLCPGARDDRPTKDVIIHVIAQHDTLDRAQAAANEAPAELDSPPTSDTPDEPVEPVAPVAPVAPVEDAAAQRDADMTSTPRQSPCPGTAFVLGAGVANAKLLDAFLDRAKIRPVVHPGDAPPEPRRRPSAALQDFVRSRDLTCRFPGCDRPAHLTDIDHTVPYPAGPTCASNLKCLCRKHHLLKTFWTGKNGWQDQQLADGTVTWTSPSGHTYTTRPGSALLFPTLCAPTAQAPLRPVRPADTDRGLKMPRRRRTRAEDRARRIRAERKLNDDLVAERNKPPPF
jgi:hypothetical protein